MIQAATIRTKIPLTKKCRYFNTGGIAPGLDVVTDCFTEEFSNTASRGPQLIMDHKTHHERLQDARERLAAFCGVGSEDLCLTHGVADGVTTVFNGFDWDAGDEVILTDEEHPACTIPAGRLCDTHGVELKFLKIAGSDEEVLQELDQLISPRTRLLALSHVTTDTGTKLPAKAIVDLAHEHKLPVLYDGAQSLGQFPVNVTDIGADFYSLLTYKWMFGPYTAGALYIEPSWQERLRVVPSSANYFGDKGVRRFEFITVPPPYYYASAAATDYLLELGLGNIDSYCTKLATRMREQLQALPGLIIENPAEAERCTGIVAFRVDGVDGAHISEELRKRGIISRPTGLKFSGVRASVSFFTDENDVNAFVGAVAEIISH